MVKQYFIPAETAVVEVEAGAGVTVGPGSAGRWRAIAGVMAEGVLEVNETHVFALLGQSNMIGRADYDGLGDYPAGTLQWTQARVLAPAISPLDHLNEQAGDMGLSIQFVTDYLASHSNVTVVLVPLAQGGTGFSGNHWNPPSDTLYAGAVASLNALFAANPTFRFKGFLWHQGEADIAEPGQYASRLDAMIAALRADVTVAEATTPFVVGGLLSGTQDSSAINQRLSETPLRMPYVGYAPATGLTLFDGLHFDAPSLRTLGARYAVALGEAEVRVPAPPGQVTGLVAQAGDGQVSLIWTAPLSHAVVSDYVIEVNAGSGWSVLTDGAGAATGFVHTGLTNGVALSYRVSAVSANGMGAASAVASATPLGATGPAGASVNRFASAASGALTATSYSFPALAIAPGTVVAAVAARGSTGGNGRPSSVTLGGQAMTLLGEQQRQDGAGANVQAQEKISFWILSGVTGTTADLAATFSASMLRCGVAVWSLGGVAPATASFASGAGLNVTSVTASVVVPAGGLLLAYGHHTAGTEIGSLAGVDQPLRLPQAEISPNFFHYAGDTLVTAGQTMTVTQSIPANSSSALMLGLVAVGPAA